MALSGKTRPFRYTFYLLAQNPSPSATVSSNNLAKFLLKLPVLLLICISLYVTLYSLKNDQYVTRKNKAREIIHVLLIISSSITNLITVYQCIFLQSTWTELQLSLGRLETEFQEALPNVTVKFTKFRTNYLIKCSVMLILYLFSIFAMIMSRLTDQKFLTSYMVVLVLINDLNAIQVMFYVDLIKFFLKSMNEALNDVVVVGDLEKCSNKKFVGSQFMASMKRLHFSVWKTVEKVNEYFGLFLLGYIVQMFLMISYDIYWIFLNKFNVGVWLCMDNALVLICALFSFFFVSNSSDKIHEEAQKTTTLLYETNDYLALSESQQFLSQILNKSIKITAKGFYKLNRSFFAGLTVGSLTSAIMLVQFQTDE